MSIRLSDILSAEAVEALIDFLSNLERIAKAFSSSLDLLNTMRVGEARVQLAEVLKLEEKGRDLRTRLEELIVSSRLEPSLKEDLLNFVIKADAIGDHVKEAARELTILPILEIPVEIRNGIVELSKLSITALQQLISAAKKTMEGNNVKALEDIKLINKYEERADQVDLANRGLLLTLADKLRPVTMSILIHDLNKDLEESVDACQVAGEYLKLIILTWLA
ncbi:MAG: DUF47 domain-containing protein [Thermosphaera aggregans]|uniref:DUF47 domain-containing protein n=1 Tax=Thermosphaera aggregans TaxID=54254 RepID=UPI003BFE5546